MGFRRLMRIWACRVFALLALGVSGVYLGCHGHLQYEESQLDQSHDTVKLEDAQILESDLVRRLINHDSLEEAEKRWVIRAWARDPKVGPTEYLNLVLSLDDPSYTLKNDAVGIFLENEHEIYAAKIKAEQTALKKRNQDRPNLTEGLMGYTPNDSVVVQKRACNEFIQAMEYATTKLLEGRYAEAMDGSSMGKAIMQVYREYLTNDQKAVMNAYADWVGSHINKDYTTKIRIEHEADAEAIREGLKATGTLEVVKPVDKDTSG